MQMRKAACGTVTTMNNTTLYVQRKEDDMHEYNTTTCCGLDQYEGLNYGDDPAQIVSKFYADVGREAGPIERYLPPFVVMTEVRPGRTNGYRKYGADKFIKYVEENGLGTVVTTPVRKNPSSNNRLRALLWTINRAGLTKWRVHHPDAERLRDSLKEPPAPLWRW
jgi:hypothetical protein